MSQWSRGLAASLFATTALPVPAVFAQASASYAEEQPSSLAEQFRDPPQSARPRVWWHWLNGNISEDGIAKDLRWMKSVGIAGALMFDGDMNSPQIVAKRKTVLSPEWLDALQFAAKTSKDLGMEFGIAASPGWSETGGPWVKPEQAMKKFVWSVSHVRGGTMAGRLAPLPSVMGPFQSVPLRGWDGKPKPQDGAIARDGTILAFPAPDGDVPLAGLSPRLSASDRKDAPTWLVDGDLAAISALALPKPGQPVWVRYDFDRLVTMRALTYVGPVGGRFAEGPLGRIEASADGVRWTVVRSLVGQAHNPAPQRTFAFGPMTAKSFRVVFEKGIENQPPFPKMDGIPVAELALVPGARTDLFEDRAAFGVLAVPDAQDTPVAVSAGAVAPDRIVDVSRYLGADGVLRWTPPAGSWIILRTGWSLTGQTNHPAAPEGTGFEVDKLSGPHVRTYLENYMSPVIKRLGSLVGKGGLQYLLNDSWEAGNANWTDAMPADFRRLRGYELTPWLPALAGYVVGDTRTSEAFLWDFRRTVAELVASNHYGTITDYAREHGLGYYAEATGAAWPTVGDGILSKRYTDIPVGEFWAIPFGGLPAAFQGFKTNEFPADIVETRSAAHVYGKPLVAAESFTSSLSLWDSTPWKLKWVADKYMAMGVNRLMIHTSAHQPDDTHRPGMTLGPFGQAFTRHESWAGLAKPWVDYLSRGSLLLQQGHAVTDVLYFYGEGAPSGVPYRGVDSLPDLRHHSYDFTNGDALLRLAEMTDGKISFPGGAHYRVLVMPQDRQAISLTMMRKIAGLVEKGAIVMGARPSLVGGLQGDASEFATITDRLWGQTDGVSLTVNPVGAGKVYWRKDVERVLEAERIAPDFSYVSGEAGLDLRFSHRADEQGHIYFITNQSDRAAKAQVSLRVAGLVPELWHADTGRTEPVGYSITNGRTEIALDMTAYDSVFVVLRHPAKANSWQPPAWAERTWATLDGQWTVHFPAGAGIAPQSFDRARGWHESNDPAVRYFAGMATYSQSFTAPRLPKQGGQLWLDLGSVGHIARVRINGKEVGTSWKPPYRLDVTGFVAKGRNSIEIDVANSWKNRFIGDKQPGAKPVAWTNQPDGGGFMSLVPPLNAETPLDASGLMGPVRLIAREP